MTSCSKGGHLNKTYVQYTVDGVTKYIVISVTHFVTKTFVLSDQ